MRWTISLALLGLLALVWLCAPASADYSTLGERGDITLVTVAAETAEVAHVSVSPPTFEVQANLTISRGDTLVIDPGTRVRFSNFTRLTILGGLIVRGNVSAPAVFELQGPGAGDLAAWAGLFADRAYAFQVANASFAGVLDIAFSNGAGAVLDNVSYQGRMTLENATAARLAGLRSTSNPYDTGRPPLWVFNSTDVEVRGADLEAGYGWGDIPSFHVFQSTNVRAWNMTVRADSFQIEGITVERSSGVQVYGLHIKRGPGGGAPGPALEAIASSDVWVEGVSIEGAPLLGALYGTDANVTVANSTLDNYTVQGTWSGNGRLVAVNVSALSVGATAGAQVWDYRLLQVESRFGSGRLVGLGEAVVENGTMRHVAPVTGGRTGWLWALAAVNRSGALELSLNYSVQVTCNCTGASASADLTGNPWLVAALTVGDVQPPVAFAPPASGVAGFPVFLNASASYDNDGIFTFHWSAPAGIVATGLPCVSAMCVVTIETPGLHRLDLRVADFAGNFAVLTVAVSVLDQRAPAVVIEEVLPARPGQNQPFVVRANATDNDPFFLPAVEWYFDGVRAPAAGLEPSFFSGAVGNHTIRLVVRDDAGNQAEATRVVYVYDSTPPSIGALSATGALRAGDRATVDATALVTDNIGVVSWHWRVQGPFTDYGLTGPVVNATFPAAGTYLVSLSVADGEGNTANRSFEVVVGAAPAAADDTLLWVALAVASVGAIAGGTLVLQRSRRR